MASPSVFAKKLAAAAQQQHDAFHMHDESDPLLAKQIEKYWKDLGMTFPGTTTPWSAVFVSWCVQKAGATKAEFLFSAQHSAFVHAAIQNADNGAGVFQGVLVEVYAPQIGDIVHNNRGNTSFDFAYARAHKSYASHSAIVVERGQDTNGYYLLTIGGNESDSIRRTLVYTNAAGFIKQRPTNPYISVIRTLK
jgi:hypothetical protein